MCSVTPGVRRQLTAAFACSIAMLTTGSMTGWPSPTLKKLRDSNSLRLTPYEEAWVANAFYYGTFISAIPSGFLMNYLGRKKSLLYFGTLSLASWILIYFSTSVNMLILARILAGLWNGAVLTIYPIYVGEISEPKVRGMLGSFSQLMTNIGNNFIFTVGPFLSVSTTAAVSALFPMLFLITFIFCPESPYFYALKKRSKAAGKSLKWLRGGEPIQDELRTIQNSVDKETQKEEGYIRKMSNLLTIPANRKAFITVETLHVFQRLSGISFLKSFSTIILPPQLGPLSADHCTMIFGLVSTASSFLSSGLVDKAGRKPLLYASSFGMGVSTLLVGIWYFLDSETTVDVSHLNWLPLAGLVACGISFSFGMGPVPGIYLGELFPSNLKGQAATMTSMIAAFSSAISTELFPILTIKFGLYSNFLLFSAVCFANILFTYVYVFETKGKSLQMIQVELIGRKVDAVEKEEELVLYAKAYFFFGGLRGFLSNLRSIL